MNTRAVLTVLVALGMDYKTAHSAIIFYSLNTSVLNHYSIKDINNMWIFHKSCENYDYD